jgi:hypothetical protein
MRFIFLILIFVSFQGYSQVWHLKRIINYDHPAGSSSTEFQDFLSFSGEVIEGSEKQLPYYTELFEWKKEHINIKVSIVFQNYETFSGNRGKVLDFDTLSDSLSYSYSLEYLAKSPYIQLQLLPFRKNPENGKIERLKNFVIRVEAIGNQSITSYPKKKSITAESSILASGKWYKIKVSAAGIYKLSYEQINSMSVGDPSNVRIYGYGGDVLPEDCRQGEKDDLLPVQVHMLKGSDGIFNAGDYILFYSKGAIKWAYDKIYGMFRQELNPYSDYSYYYVTSGGGPDIPANDLLPSADPDKFTDTYDYRSFHEQELKNVLLSGKQWFGEDFTSTQQQNFSFIIPELKLDQPVEILTQVMAQAIGISNFYLSYNNVNIDTFYTQAASLSDYTSTFGYTDEQKTQLSPLNENISLRMKFIKPEPSAKGWLDYITINARADLQMRPDFLEFRDIETSSPGNVTQFTLAMAGDKTVIWDVTDQNNILRMTGTLTGTELSFKASTDDLREFVAFNENGIFPSPVLQGDDVGSLPNQNLHGSLQPDMVVISYSKFLVQAERLAAYRREKSGLDVMVVTPEQVYNEFSSGTPDISAYRNFMKMLYDRAGTDSTLLPRYLLLFGDGTYDNKGITENATNYILTYQSDNSLAPTASYVSDDFFALLDPGENMNSGLLDIGVGRLPVGTADEAESMVDKILDYEIPERMGDWRNALCFIGDDEDGNIHMSDADAMAQYVEAHYPGFNINKIYLDAYKQVMTPVGQMYPDVNLAISEQVSRGALIINYTGHGGIKGWAHEQILGVNDIDGWTNSGRLPLFMTATCEFSRYDDHLIPSAGEKVLLNPHGGGIALLTTTRLVYSQPNRVLNEKFYQIVFEKDKNGENYRLGDIMEYTKNQAGSGINKRNFTLLGDPSQRLSYPEYLVFADSLNGKSVTEQTDTLQALRKVTVTGHVADIKGKTLTGFNGVVYPTVYDKSAEKQTLANDGGSKKTFTLRNNILYKGKSTVENGIFSFTFIVPKDISYAFGKGRISFYAEDSLVDASGAYNGVTIGGTFPEAVNDLEGPELKVFMNSSTFRSGGMTDENPTLYVEVSDNFGINTTGNGIGHDITAILDDKSQNLFQLNGYYQSELNSFRGGQVRYPFHDLEPGHHTVSVKVWDIYNNSSMGSTDFIVIKTNKFLLEDLMTKPNPFSDYTNISFGHNKPGTDMTITVDIYTMAGKLVKTIKTKEAAEGYRSQDIYWDGSEAKNGQNIFIYIIRVKTSEGQVAEKSGKLIVIR